MPYATDRDRNPTQQELEEAPWPVAPLNLFLTSGYMPGVYDLSWDSPTHLSHNSRFWICGVNIYRSIDSEFGPYDRITDFPVGSIFWRDQTDNVVVLDETVEDDQWVIRGPCSAGMEDERYVFRTRKCPISQPGSQVVPDARPESVQVTVNGEAAPLLAVIPETGEIEIDTIRYANTVTQKLDDAPLIDDNAEIKVSYRYNRFVLRTNLDHRTFYRVTTVGIPAILPLDKAGPQDLVETPLERAAFTSSKEIEKIDWIWREGVRRNRWILSQGGERVKVFIRKTAGVPCLCRERAEATHKQPVSDCDVCYGTGFVGGYEGPYDVVIAPDDAERRVAQRDTGRTLEHSYEVWTGPSPMLSQRDFLVKINGERYSIGPVRFPTNRGMVLQQHFSIGHLDEGDIRFKVPMDQPRGLVVTQVIPPQQAGSSTTDKPAISDERELRGRTVTWENIVY